MELLKDDEAEEIYDRVKKDLFKIGLVLDNVSVRKLLYSFVYLYFMFTWPIVLFKIYVVGFIKGIIKRL